MKLVTFRHLGQQQDCIGALVNDQVLEFIDDHGNAKWPSMLSLIEAGPSAWDDANALVQSATGPLHAMDAVTLRAPIPLPPQYRDAMVFHQHIRQSFPAGAILKAKFSGDPAAIASAEAAAATFEVPEVHHQLPVYYKGNRFAVGNPDQTIIWPSYSLLMDFELELACVIGKGGRDIAKADATDHIFGFMVLNDLSARDAQAAEMDGLLGPAKGKDFDNANVFGPCLVTADEISDPYALKMKASVNGEIWGKGNSSDMHWSFEQLIERISLGETLYPGEIIGSGTVGNGCGLEHQRFLNEGDVIELEIEKIGILRNTIIRAE
ncbi:putative protein YisK [Halioglobus japonicus]|nr:putative protein YisK [Halioglobus japonicus]